ncbi:MFS/sugar transport protein [Leifsonia sp. 98AMF]|jgi:MFS family permease|uniref:MFS transporter n=1 Tax=Microbacteriaceae TaxID=85023 RepID=UPI0003737590|nr:MULTISPECIES: MFS transporter [Microbacteriaceae]SDH47857.1 MFS/sugar transport protein [Leifsonia sp. 197AMF]SDI89724.1 MFS/sugar transport protein [Leifsonia sp. 466MF]SDJ90831.1 MFS/sugar transport protein [Leifsonia sp. 157MF]SDN93432.1 MFS/sugar transport protein [Leifsonia sp. 509MF]SEN12304.1 MFS/sugar transport protein [Leifsonia sp. 467MF]
MTNTTTPAVFAEPVRKVPGRWIAAFAVAWLGVWMAQLAPIQKLLPDQVQAQLHSDWWVDNVIAFGVISGISGVCAIVAYPLTGALSDRTTSRFGRRRPWIAAGAVVFAVSLVLLGLQTTMVGMGVFWSLALTGFCILTAALTATISDQVPVDQRGYVSGWISAPQAIGIILGVALVTYVFVGAFVGYTAMAVLLVVLVLPFLFLPDAVLPVELRERMSFRGVIEGLWISPREHPDFGWTLLSRVLVNFGNAFGTSLLLYFLEFGLRDPNADDDLLILILVYMVFVIVASLVLGRLSDRLGRRKAFVFASSAVQGVAALLLAFVPQLSVAIVAAALLGIGYGCFLSVDQALATQVLPDPESRGKDLGIMNIALAVPQAVAPLFGAMIVAALGGFAGLFVLSAVFAFAGALAVARVKAVR